MRQISWPTAVVVSVAIIALVVLAGMRADASMVAWVILAVLGGAGAAQLNAVREQTNGNTTEQLRIIRETQVEQARLISALSASVAAAPPARAEVVQAITQGTP